MRLRSVYEVDCPCGRHITSETKTTRCICGRVIVMEWPASDAAQTEDLKCRKA